MVEKCPRGKPGGDSVGDPHADFRVLPATPVAAAIAVGRLADDGLLTVRSDALEDGEGALDTIGGELDVQRLVIVAMVVVLMVAKSKLVPSGDVTITVNEDPDKAITYGSAPANISYSVYDGNYLNWKNSPASVTMSRSNIMKAVATAVLSSVNNLNVGLMRFDGGDGGAVILDITDLDSNRQDVIDAINALPASGVTPLSETLYESALYWRGMTARYGQPAMSTLTDPNALASTSPSVTSLGYKYISRIQANPSTVSNSPSSSARAVAR